ncbi:lipopolysaccharide biosynthesis protein, partial [Variovorax sp. 2RAF20]
MARFLARADEDGRLPDHFATLYRLWILMALAIPVLAAVVLRFWPMAPALKAAIAAAFAAAAVKSLAKMSQE